MNETKRVHCARSTTRIDDFRSGSDLEERLSRHFSESELRALEGKPPRGLAGAMAIKEALQAVFSMCSLKAELKTLDFVLETTHQGAPRVRRIRGLSFDAESNILRVSMTHTRNWAHGFAAIDEGPFLAQLHDNDARA